MKINNVKKQLAVFVMLFSMISSYAQITKAEIIATGLTCSMCSNAINKQLKTLPEVEKVLIDLNNNTFMVTLKKNTAITPQVLRANIEKAGFFVGSMVLTVQIDNTQKNNNGFKNTSGTYVLVDSKEDLDKDNIRVKVLNSGFVTKKEYKQSAKMLSKYMTGAPADTYYVKTI
ncbi:MAG TPA: heavy metal-associated domain-containing protein [Flavobacterium sp.]|nr:heavy metal-associated domain-containing protein [Flavobacterium sp.]